MRKIIIAFVFTIDAVTTFAQKDIEYPQEVVKLGLSKLYDQTKWALYCIHSDEIVKFTKESKIQDKKVTYGVLPLKFHNLLIRHDTVEMNFFFYYRKKRADSRLVENFPTWGAVFVSNSDHIVLYSSRSTMRYYWSICKNPKDCKDRFAKPLQPEVIRYIKENKKKIDPWFRKEAIKRGVISG